MIQGADGFLYGTTLFGGPSNGGVVFKILPNGTGFSVIHSFECATADNCSFVPVAGLIQGTDGFLYGTTVGSAGNISGTVFKISPDGTGFSIIHSFEGATDGVLPFAGLIQGADGFLYGTTQDGGAANRGTVFKVLPDGTGSSVIKSFQGGPTDGRSPLAGLIQLSDGLLYGTTRFGGTSDQGTIFKISPDGTGGFNSTVIYSFNCSAVGDGCLPEAGFIKASDGNLYSVAARGGVNASGTIYLVLVGPDIAATVTVTATDSAAAEAGPNPGVFTVTRTGDTTNALTVNFTVGGTASAGTDYNAIGTSVLIPAGASSVTITVTPIADALIEGSETVNLTLASGTGYTVGNPSTATVTIADYTGGLLRGQPQVNFGSVPVGSTADRPLNIQNGSTTASLVVKVNSPTPNPLFSLVSGGGTVVIAPGGSHTVVLRFAPTTAGNTSGSLLINSTDSAIPSKTVSLAGRGR